MDVYSKSIRLIYPPFIILPHYLMHRHDQPIFFTIFFFPEFLLCTSAAYISSCSAQVIKNVYLKFISYNLFFFLFFAGTHCRRRARLIYKNRIRKYILAAIISQKIKKGVDFILIFFLSIVRRLLI